jgi:S-DNA-T family DNA segregation ATPase FtsK/SpoIIIE
VEQSRNFNNVLILYNSDFYKEINLDDYEKDTVVIGNTSNCDIKIKLKCESILSIYFVKLNTSWQVRDGENSYCVVNDIKTPRKVLSNGDQITVKDLKEKEALFQINFFIDFVIEKENYDKVISLNNTKELSIGSDINNNIVINDELIDRNHCEIKMDENHKYFVCDLKSKYGVYIDGKKVEDKSYLNDNNFIIICGYKMLFRNNSIAVSNLNEKISINGLTVYNKDRNNSVMEFPCFYRSPRLLLGLPTEKVEIEKPPDKANKVSMNSLLMVLPLIGTAVMMGLMSSSMGSNKTYMFFSVGMVAISGITSIIVFIGELISSRKHNKKRKKFYTKYVEDKENEIVDKIKLQEKNIKAMNPETDECLLFVKDFNRRLWERDYKHEDFLSVMLGHGDCDLSFEITIPKEEIKMEIDELEVKGRELKQKYNHVSDVPLCLNLMEANPIGLIGNSDNCYNFLFDMMVKITANHYSEDVKIVVLAPKKDEEKWNWIRWMPHIWTSKKEIRFMAFNKDSAHIVLNHLYEIAKSRDEDKNHNKEENIKLPQYVVVISDMSLVENEPVMYYLENKNSVNITTIFMNESIEMIPKESSHIIEINDKHNGKVVEIQNADRTTEFTFNNVDIRRCMEYSKKMAPIYVKSSFTENSLRNMITLFDLYKVTRTEDFKVFHNWQNNKVYKTMAVPLGVKIGDEKVYLDLHEKFHGPHGLVAGTTGSGKSEILQTYIASLAINYHPYDIALIIIDYKGGGMANLFKNLPHLVGTITNLDGNQINRSLVSIKSELKRRQRIFGKYDVNHIDAYIKLYKENKVTEPIPHLILIADEFAELKSDQPEFMAELVSTARIGRSLGVHLILATQKPAGVVDNQIWSNSKFKLCLKVQDAEDSKEVLKSPVAANIVEPGRAYFQVGNNEIFELFQSAWSGAKKYDEDDVNKKEVEIFDVAIDGTRSLLYSTKDKEKDKNRITQLDATIEEIDKVCKEHGIERLNGPWLPPLEDKIYLQDLIKDSKTGFNGEKWRPNNEWICPTIGMLDDPERQSQRPIKLDIGELGHVLLIGAPGYGKTTFLQTLITSLILEYTPQELNIYILDFGTRTLKMFESSYHVGGVVTSDEEEKLMNLIKYLHKEVNRRKQIFSKNGVGSLKAYRENGDDSIPQIVIIIDNYAALSEFYAELEDEFIFLSREGGTLGISLIITAGNYSSVRYKITGNFKLCIGLTCVDKGEYSNIAGRVRMEPENKKGRALIKIDNVYEFQIALPAYGENESDRSLSIKKIIEDANSKWRGDKAKLIPLVPKVLDINTAVEELEANKAVNKYTYPVGIDYSEIEQLYGNLMEKSLLTIIGKSKTGKSNIIKSIAYSLNMTVPLDEIQVYLIDSGNYGLLDMKESSSVKAYCYRTEEARNAMHEIKHEIELRKNAINDLKVNNLASFNEKEYLESIPLITIFIDDINDLILQFDKEKEVLNILADIVEKDRNLKVSIIIAGTEENFNKYVYTYGFVKQMKKENYGFLLDSITSQKFYEVQVPYNLKEKNFEKGDCYFINNDEFIKVKTAFYKL